MNLENMVERKLSGWVNIGFNKIKFEKKGHIAIISKQNDQYLWEVRHHAGSMSYGKCATEELARQRVEGKIQ